MKLLFHPDAEREFHEGIRQYLLIDPALGADFEAKVDVIVEFFEDDVEGEDAHVAMANFPLDGECAGIGG